MANGTVRLGVQKGSFTKDEEYTVDVIANATQRFACKTRSELINKVQKDYYVQVTGGIELGAFDSSIQGIPANFLMDGTLRNQVVNNGDATDTKLEVTLSRAVAKIEVKLHADDNVDFVQDPMMGFIVKNLPYSSSYLAEVPHTAYKRNTNLFSDNVAFFKWVSEDLVTITFYAYSSQWTANLANENGTRLMVNLPLQLGEEKFGVNDAESMASGNVKYNYYQVLLTKQNSLNRNTFYKVEATISASGGVSMDEGAELQELKYSAEDWNDVQLNIGNDHRPTYLTVNKTELDMKNIAEDNTSLVFFSSSDVTVQVKDIWYLNKLGKRIDKTDNDVSTHPIDYKDENDATKRTTMKGLFDNIVKAGADEGNTGNISVYSPVPLNNIVRYIELEVRNSDNSNPVTILVRQYPLEYITSTQGYYSYRSDFGTTYERAGTNYITRIGTDERLSSGSPNSPLFASKYVNGINTNTGESQIYWYYWTWSNRQWSYVKKTDDNDTLDGLKNGRMYHVRITSTSDQYNIGIPRQTIEQYEATIGGVKQVHPQNITDDDIQNNKLVSPSFMIASQLGASLSPSNREVAERHCAQYVETYKDENGDVVHLTNWRLPTKAEIEIIIKFQIVPNAAMDKVLSGKRYWSALGTVDTEENVAANEATAVRCVRDVN